MSIIIILYSAFHVFADKSAVITELSKQWSTLADEDKEAWKVKASETSAWTDVPKKKRGI